MTLSGRRDIVRGVQRLQRGGDVVIRGQGHCQGGAEVAKGWGCCHQGAGTLSEGCRGCKGVGTLPSGGRDIVRGVQRLQRGGDVVIRGQGHCQGASLWRQESPSRVMLSLQHCRIAKAEKIMPLCVAEYLVCYNGRGTFVVLI